MSPFIIGALSIVIIDVLLAGDNAVMIALAVRGLPLRQRRIGILSGAGIAVVLRVVLTFFAAKLLTVEYVRLAGGLMILWIAVQLLADSSSPHTEGKAARSLWQAIWLVLVADITMSLDNILAVAAASKGDMRLLIFGLGLSIPFVVFTSDIVSKLMDRFPIVIYLGAAILGRVGGEMIVADFHPSRSVEYGSQIVCAIAVLAIGNLLGRRNRRKAAETAENTAGLPPAATTPRS